MNSLLEALCTHSYNIIQYVRGHTICWNSVVCGKIHLEPKIMYFEFKFLTQYDCSYIFHIVVITNRLIQQKNIDSVLRGCNAETDIALFQCNA